MNILLLEDEIALADWVVTSLETSGHTVDHFGDGRSALIAATTQDYDLLILDRMVPELDGLSVMKTLRATKSNVAILMLTSLNDIDDRVEGLEAGADDYLTKPFAQSELRARVMALGRRGGPQAGDAPTKLVYQDVELDLLGFTVKRAGQNLDLKPKEIRLLETFMRNKGRVLTRSMLLERVWKINFDPSTNVVDTHVSRLRAKLDKPFDHALIETVRGAGYVFGRS
jgi:DNA-binding response OmpR family regulator